MRFGVNMKNHKRFLNKLNHISHNESGETLPGLLVSSVVGGFVLIAAGSFVFSALSSNNNIAEQTSLSSTSTLLDTSLRDDVVNATVITPKSPTSVEFIIPGDNSTCKVNTWNITANATSGLTQINKSVQAFPSQGLNATGISVCTGTATGTTSNVLATNIDATAKFTFANSVNRPVAVSTAGVLSLPAATLPTTAPAMPQATWDKRNVSRVGLDTVIKGFNTETVAFKFNQFSALASSANKLF